MRAISRRLTSSALRVFNSSSPACDQRRAQAAMVVAALVDI
jgi:hypothetical protein